MTSTELLDLHQKAMFFAQDALVATHRGDKDNALSLYKNAFDIEREVAMSLVDSDNEPIRSVLFRSAASLALNCGLDREAEIMISYGLIGKPPTDIHQELLQLLEDVKVQRQLKEKDDTITLIGYLKMANARTNKIRLVNGTENKDINVSHGMSDMVRTFFDDKVRAVVRKIRGNHYELVNLVKEE
jgi:hypothetical protein